MQIHIFSISLLQEATHYSPSHLLYRPHRLLPCQPAQVGPSLPGQVSQCCPELPDHLGATLEHFLPRNRQQQGAEHTQPAESAVCRRVTHCETITVRNTLFLESKKFHLQVHGDGRGIYRMWKNLVVWMKREVCPPPARVCITFHFHSLIGKQLHWPVGYGTSSHNRRFPALSAALSAAYYHNNIGCN